MITLEQHIKITRRFRRFSNFAKFVKNHVNRQLGLKLMDWNYDRWDSYDDR